MSFWVVKVVGNLPKDDGKWEVQLQLVQLEPRQAWGVILGMPGLELSL